MSVYVNIILLLSVLSPLFSVWIGRKQRSIIWAYAIICFLTDAISLSLKGMHINHTIVSNVFLIIEFLLISTYFKKELLPKRYSVACKVILAIIVLVYIYSSVVIMMNGDDKEKNYNYKAGAFFCMTYIIYSLLGLYKLMKEMLITRLEKSQLFLTCIAFLLYASGALLIFLAKDEVVKIDKDFFTKAWPFIFLPLNIIKNIILGFGLKTASNDAK